MLYTLCASFVPAPANLALGRPTFMSGIKNGRGGSLAVDGNKSPDTKLGGSCSVADPNPKPWWAVDLGAIFNVKEVAISQLNSYGKH